MIWLGGFGWGPGTVGLVIGLFFLAVNVLGLLLVLRHHRGLQRDGQSGQPPLGGGPPQQESQETLRPSPSPVNKSEAVRILEERYAEGEIDRDEFLQRRDDLLDD